MTRSTVSEWALPWDGDGVSSGEERTVLVLAWSLDEPSRLGEVAFVEGPALIGRDTETATPFFRERPSGKGNGRPLVGSRLSRRQLELAPSADGALSVVNVGKCPLLVNGKAASAAVVRAGDTVALRNSLVFAVVRRRALPSLRSYPARLAFPFGEADAHGIVGESPAIWALRDALAFAAASANHVLLHGPSGAGKELAARAVHGLSARAGGPFIARNAATLPDALVDAELFGNTRNYPNPGMPERKGLIGEADGGTLFLDEIGELPATLQSHLLRVLDRGGEYQRLGDGRTSRSDLRVVCATNREPTDLKHDLLARFASRLEVPSLDSRREDIPLLLRHLLARATARTPELARFVDERGEGRLDPALVERLLRRRYTHELRELERLLWVAAASSPGQYIAASAPFLAELGDEAETAAAPAPLAAAGDSLSRDDLLRALREASGSVTRAARKLGLKNRFALYRAMKRHGLEPEESGGDPEDEPGGA